MVSANEKESWEALQSTYDIKTRDKLFNQYQDWAKWIAYGVYKNVGVKNIELEEFEQYAYEGLLDAISKFSIYNDVKFTTFAEYRVKGNILNHLPSLTESAAYYKRRKEKVNEIISTEQRGEDIDPIINLVNVVEDLAINYFINEQSSSKEQYGGNYYSSPEMHTIATRVKKTITLLKDPMRSVLNGYYIKGLSFTKISKILNLTRSRISQCHKKGLQEVRKLLGWDI